MSKIKKIIIFLVCIFFIFSVWWVFYLKKAHSTFENYYAFRGCVQLIERTDTYGICKLKGGEEIKIVKFNGKWFLDGDLPICDFKYLCF